MARKMTSTQKKNRDGKTGRGWEDDGADEWTSCWGRYLSDDQRAVFAGRGARVALAFVVNNHGLHRLGLSVAQPGGPAGEQGEPFTTDHVLLARLTQLIHSGPPALNGAHSHSPGVLGAGGRLLARFLINLFVVVFIGGVRFLAGGGIIRHLIGGADVVHGAQLLG